MEEQFSIAIPDSITDPGARLDAFYKKNGYEVCAGDELRWTRGTRRAGWWSSNMCDLHVTVTVEIADDTALLNYDVDTSGQIMSDEDRAFWRGESRAAQAFLRDELAVVDLRPKEAKRAQQVASEYRRLAVTATMIVFVMVFAFGAVADRLGWL